MLSSLVSRSLSFLSGKREQIARVQEQEKHRAKSLILVTQQWVSRVTGLSVITVHGEGRHGKHGREGVPSFTVALTASVRTKLGTGFTIVSRAWLVACAWKRLMEPSS